MDGLIFAIVTGLVASVSPTGVTAAIVAASVGRRSSGGYLAGSLAARVVQASATGIAALALFTGAGARTIAVAPWQYLTTGLVGATLAISAAITLAHGGTAGRIFTEEELHEPRVALATGFGVVLSSARQWLFATAVVARLGAERLHPTVALAAFALFVVAANWVPLGLLALRTVRPHGGERFFRTVRDVVGRHLHQLGPAIALVVGAFLLVVAVDGYAGLGIAETFATLLF